MAIAPVSGLDSILFQKSFGIYQFGAFADAVPRLNGGPSNAVSFNGFNSIVLDVDAVDSPGSSFDGTVFGGMGIHALGPHGPTFDPTEYQLELTYKLGPNNAADKVAAIMTQHDGFAGGSQGEAYGFFFDDLDVLGSTTSFTTVTRDITLLPNPQTGSVTEPWDTRQPSSSFDQDGDGLQDYDQFQNGAPNGLYDIQLQSVFGSAFRLNMEVASLRLVPKTPDATVAKLSGDSGLSFEFGPYTNGVTRDGEILAIDAEGFPGTSFGGAGIRTPKTSFDGTTAMVAVTAKLGASNTASGLSVIMNDVDGDDTSAGQGAEEWGLFFESTDFNTDDFVTVMKPLNEAVVTNPSAFGFSNSGDGSLDAFDLFQLQALTQFNGFDDRLQIEIMGIEILTVQAPLSGDYNGDGVVNAIDYTIWRDNEGGDNNALNGNGDETGGSAGVVDGVDYTAWAANYAATNGGGASIPEPATAVSFTLATICVLTCRQLRTKE